MGQSPEEAGHKLPKVLSFASSLRVLNSSGDEFVTSSCLPRALIRDSVPRDFSGGWSHWHLLTTAY